MLVCLFTNGPNPIRLHMTHACFRKFVCFSEKHLEFMLQTCRPCLLFKLASMLLKLISQDGDVSVLFLSASIVHFVQENALNELDLSQIVIKLQSLERECVVCFGQTQLCLCLFCGACTCSECFEKISNQTIKLCPACRDPQMFKTFAGRRQDNTLLWTAMLFFLIFGKHIHSFEKVERLDLESMRGSLIAFLQQHEPFRYSPVMCIARWDSVEVSAKVASDCESAEDASDCVSAMYD